MSSYGHIRDLKKKDFSIDIEHGFEPIYEIPQDKMEVVSKLKKAAGSADVVWLASDEDREGEAIAWHLREVLNLDPKRTRRIVFHEITKPAILAAIENPRELDVNLVDAQQARRVLDRLVGFELSPVLWKKIKPALSAGRVQSVAVRLIAEREKEIAAFKSEEYYRVTGVMSDTKGNTVGAALSRNLASKTEATQLLEHCKSATFTIADVNVKPVKKSPAPPFTTSTLQQEASRKLGFTVAQTMRVAQSLYENGHITYMRTDSVNLSRLALGAIGKEIEGTMGKEYLHIRNYHTSTKGAQEAHEAIRPTVVANHAIEGTAQEKRLYNLIWKRTVASQMAEAQLEKTTIEIAISGRDEHFKAEGEVVKFDGFLKVYLESSDDEKHDEQTAMLPPLHVGEQLSAVEVTATQRFTQQPLRYTEASLVRRLEELGIGRPSTYAPTISTIQQREYVQKGDKKGEDRLLTIDTLKDGKTTRKNRRETIGADKGKLIPTDVGTVVNDFLMENFPDIMDYNFTATVEKEFDKIAEGKEEWADEIGQFYKHFEPEVEKVMNSRSAHKAGERELGKDPDSGKPVFVKIGKFGPVIQIGSADDSSKPRFAQLPADKSMEDITLDEALELFRLPRNLGEFEGEYVRIGTGRFGPYILHNKKYVSLPKDEDPLTVSLETAIRLIEEKRSQEQKRHLKTFDEDQKLEVMNGRFGPYVVYDGANYRLPKAMHERAAELSYEECMEIVRSHPATTKQRKKR